MNNIRFAVLLILILCGYISLKDEIRNTKEKSSQLAYIHGEIKGLRKEIEQEKNNQNL